MKSVDGFKNFGMADFPKKEFELRWRNAQNLMDEQGIDAILLTQNENISYFTGFRQTYYYGVCYYFVLPSEGEPVFVSPISMRGNIESMTWIDDARFFGKDAGGSAEAIIRELMKKLGMSNKTLGVELEGYGLGQGMLIQAPYLMEAIKRDISNVELVDASKLVWDMRVIKSPLEIEYIRKSVDISCKAFKTALESLRVGMTEKEYAGTVYKTMIDEGGVDTPLMAALNCRAGPERYTHFDTRPTDRKMRKGDWVMLDGGMTYRGYWSDITRQACIGPPSKKQEKLYEIALKATEAGIEAIGPGVHVQAVVDASFNAVKESGFEKHLISEGVGHGFGLSIHERPWLRLGVDAKLEPGMILAIEPTLYDTPIAEYLRNKPDASGLGGEGIFAVEDNLLVTSSGNEVLSGKLSKEAWVAN